MSDCLDNYDKAFDFSRELFTRDNVFQTVSRAHNGKARVDFRYFPFKAPDCHHVADFDGFVHQNDEP